MIKDFSFVSHDLSSYIDEVYGSTKISDQYRTLNLQYLSIQSIQPSTYVDNQLILSSKHTELNVDKVTGLSLTEQLYTARGT